MKEEINKYERLSPKNIFEKNKFAIVTIQTIKENIINDKMPIYNPLFLNGLDKGNRSQFFFRTFTKDFNSAYKDKFQYFSCDEICIDKVKNKKFIIIENFEFLNNNITLQEKMLEIINYCLNEFIQVILCSNDNIENLKINNNLKNKLMHGLEIYLVK